MSARSSLPEASLAAFVFASGCSLLLGDRTEQCRSHADCQALDPDYVCASDGVCVPIVADTLSLQRASADGCRTDADCSKSLGLALCRDGSCLPLNSVEKGCFSSGLGTTLAGGEAGVLPIGLLVPRDELGANAPKRGISGAVALAIAEFNQTRTELPLDALPALVGVQCDESRPEALGYLLDELRVRVIFGPTDTTRVVAALALSAERALFIPPFADGPSLVADGDLGGDMLSCRPSHSGARNYLLDAIAEARSLIAARGDTRLNSITPALAVSGDVATTRFAENFDDGVLAAAGVRRVPYVPEPGARGLVNALGSTDSPITLVVAASAVDAWENNIPAVDGATFAKQGLYPYYLLAEKTIAVLQTTLRDQVTAQAFPRQYLRVLGLDYARSDQSEQLRAEFSNAYSAMAQSSPEPGLEYVYDCMYVASYAALAASIRLQRPLAELTPDAILLGLRALQGGGPAQSVGALHIPDVLRSLQARSARDGSVDLIGASSDLEFQLGADAASTLGTGKYVGIAPPDGELYCIDARSQTYCDTQIVFPASGGSPRRPTAARCACLSTDP